MRCSFAAKRGKALGPARQWVTGVPAHAAIVGLLRRAMAHFALLAVSQAPLHQSAVTASELGD